MTYSNEDPQYPHVKDGTSRYGFLDVKAALDKLSDIMTEESAPTPTPARSSSSSGCDAGLLSALELLFLIFPGLVGLAKRR